ncbi:MAG: glycosyltransferase [Isosphaeraceae bacterium]|nr:glycosyltransferase [Isosphaeraceae bacterium]
MAKTATHIYVLNYNGRALLEECLPSLIAAAQASSAPCRVSVIDNASTDDSIDYLEGAWPEVGLIREPNRGLASFNSVLARTAEPIVLLLNNDVKLEPGAVDPLVEAIESNDDALFAAPLCWTFDGLEYEGMRTRVTTSYGLVRGCARVPGHWDRIHLPDLTASAGPVLAVHRERFLALGGYDPVYFPGRIEDLDLGFRGWMAGLRGYYVPASVAYHKGFGAFEPAFGKRGCDRLAARNTLIFAWKNLSGRRLVGHLAWLPFRVVHSLLMGRSGFVSAALDAVGMLRRVLAIRRDQHVGRGDWVVRQEAFFARFRY